MKRSERMMLATITLIALGFPPGQSSGQIVGSAHDFSGEVWSGGSICLPCHTPHHGNTDAIAPLWNHEMTSATYLLYQSTWLHEPTVQPGPQSVICLSCHDGTVALDSFGGNTGSTFISGTALIDTDLRDDHPIGIKWSHQYPNLVCSNCHDPYGGGEPVTSALPFYVDPNGDARIECMTCHDVHNEAGFTDGMLRMSSVVSEICQYCHAK